MYMRCRLAKITVSPVISRKLNMYVDRLAFKTMQTRTITVSLRLTRAVPKTKVDDPMIKVAVLDNHFRWNTHLLVVACSEMLGGKEGRRPGAM